MKSVRLFVSYSLYLLFGALLSHALKLPNGFSWLLTFMIIVTEHSVIERIREVEK
jgi:hypothetical protein